VPPRQALEPFLLDVIQPFPVNQRAYQAVCTKEGGEKLVRVREEQQDVSTCSRHSVPNFDLVTLTE
jgi:hypothetical protein